MVGVDELEYKTLVSYASSFVDVLLFIHYISLILIEIQHLRPRYYVKVRKNYSIQKYEKKCFVLKFI